MKILVVEDEPLVAMAVEDALTSAGITVVGPAGSITGALKLIEAGGIDGAFLDVNLRGERIDPVADALDARGIPFVFTTGYGAAELPAAHAARPMLGKPFSDDDVTRALAQNLRRA